MAKDFGGATAGYANIGLPTKADEEVAMEQTIRALAKDRYNCHAREDVVRSVQTNPPALPTNKTGWREARPLENPAGVETLRIIDRMLPATRKEVALSTGAQKIKQLVETARAHIKENEQLIAETKALASETSQASASQTTPPAPLKRRGF